MVEGTIRNSKHLLHEAMSRINIGEIRLGSTCHSGLLSNFLKIEQSMLVSICCSTPSSNSCYRSAHKISFLFTYRKAAKIISGNFSQSGRITASRKQSGLFKIIQEGIISTNIGAPEVIAAPAIFSPMFAGENQAIIFIINFNKDEIKKPGNPLNGQTGEELAFCLLKRHLQVNFSAALSALPAFSP
jgi:hypothetical protein